MLNNPTCVVDGRVYEAVKFETSPENNGNNYACELCVATPGAGLCYRLDTCLINGAYYYWRADTGNRPVRTLHSCATCLSRRWCPGAADPCQTCCDDWEPIPDIHGCCCAAVMLAGAVGLLICACFAVFTR